MVSKVPLIKSSRASRPRNGFDLSQRHMFTAHAGMLLPVLTLDLLVHDHVRIVAKDFMRTLPMNTSAMLSMRGVYEFYFVPYHQLFPQFDQFIAGTKDFSSSVLSNVYSGNVPRQVPTFMLRSFFDAVNAQLDTNVDDCGYPVKYGAYRLLDLLGYGRLYDSKGDAYSDGKEDVQQFLPNTVSPLRICAYNKIYQDFYRNSHYEGYDVDSFSIASFSGTIPSGEMLKRFKLRYRNAQADYFTNIRPSQFFSLGDTFSFPVVNTGVSPAGSIVGSNSRDTVNGNSLGGFVSTGYSYVEDKGNVTSAQVNINVASIRSAFAVDKLLSISMRAGKTFLEQMEAHYGVKVSDGRDGRCTYIGGFDSNISVSDVDQTSGTTQVGEYSPLGGYLGRSTGKGVGSGSGVIEFDAPEHGILMCMYSLVPGYQYDSLRIDPMNVKSQRYDFFTPEFENLGMQPLYSSFVSTLNWGVSVPLGYQPRYSEYKTAVDVNHGQFVQFDALSYYTASRIHDNDNALSSITVRTFKIDPRWFNSVFVVDYNGRELTDCVFGGCNFNIVKVSDMSVDGMPRA